MGYDDDECLECYCSGGGNEPCSNFLETCLTCVDKICVSSTPRVISALKNFDWSCTETCTKCDSTSITLNVPLCDHHLKQRFTNDPNLEYNCYLCDHEGKCYYPEDETNNNFAFCDECELNLQVYCKKRDRGKDHKYNDNYYHGTCSECNLDGIPVVDLPLCNYHIELTK
jgi:hypothetical protein